MATNEEKAAELGVSYEVVDRAISKVSYWTFNYLDAIPEDLYARFPKVLTEEELVAIIRWWGLDQRFTQLFTWDGAVQNDEQ